MASIEDDPLHDRLTDALRGAAMDLAIDDHRIDDAADIVDRDIALYAHRAELGIDLDLGRRGAVGIGVKPRADRCRRRQGAAQRIGRAWGERVGCDLEQPKRAIRARDSEAPVSEDEIALGDFEPVGGELLAARDDGVRCPHENRAAQSHRAIGMRARARDRYVAVSPNRIATRSSGI